MRAGVLLLLGAFSGAAGQSLPVPSTDPPPSMSVATRPAGATGSFPAARPPALLSGDGSGDGLLAEGAVERLRTPGGAFAASLILPGAGQAALGLRRWVVYGGLELGFWVLRLDALGDERRFRSAYRDLAWSEARLPGPYPRQDGGWGYYETMSHYLRSGAYDTDPSRAGTQPETDLTTYNGVVWDLARSIYLPGGEGGPETPSYDAALDYYAARAAGPAFLWSWEGNEGALDRFRALIADADGASRTAGAALGLVLANHVASAVDALLAARMQSKTGVRLESRLSPAVPLRWSVGLRIPIRNRIWTSPLKR